MLSCRPEILFAYIHGSILEHGHPHDVDVAVYLNADACERYIQDGCPSLDYAILLEMALEADAGMPADVQVLNRAPLSFRARVASQGKVVVDRDPGTRIMFESLSRREYLDFLPKRRMCMEAIFA